MITHSNSTKGLALLNQVGEIYGKVYKNDSLLETVFYWEINFTVKLPSGSLTFWVQKCL